MIDPYRGLTEDDFEALESGWLVLTETQAMDLTGAGGPYPLPTRYGVFAEEETNLPNGVMAWTSSEGVIVLGRVGEADGSVERFVESRVVPSSPASNA